MKKIINLIVTIVFSNIIMAQNAPFVLKASVAKNKQTQKVSVQLKFINYTDVVSNYSINVFRREATTGWQKVNTTVIEKVSASKQSPFANDKSYQRYANFVLRKIEPDKEKNTKAFAGIALLKDNKMAEYAGCYFEDKNVEAAKTYQYKITNANKADEELAAPISITTNSNLQKINDFSYRQSVQNILLNWQLQEDFFSYKIFRKSATENEEVLLTKTPLIVANVKEKVKEPILFVDANLLAGKKYNYHIIAYDVLGNEMATSDNLSVVVKDLIMPTAVTNFTNERKEKSFILKWQPTNDKKCIGYNIYRNTEENITFKKVNNTILAATANSFTDNITADATAYTYYIESVGNNGNTSKSIESKAVMPDITPPAKPTQIKATVTPGIITLTWQANKEKDVKGYWVYRATTKKSGYFNIIHEQLITTNSFIDTLPKTSKNDFVYKVQAVDFAYNKSEMSDTVMLNLPDITPPSTVQNIEAQLNNNLIAINWSKAIDEDVAGYSIYKVTDMQTKNGIKLNTQLLQNTSFDDKNIETNGNVIAYYVTVTDKSNNVSEPSAFTYITLPLDTTQQVAVNNLAIQKNEEEKTVNLSWRNTAQKFDGFMVFRKSSEEENFVAISDLITATNFKDNNTETRLTYEYYVRTYFTNGTYKNSAIVK